MKEKAMAMARRRKAEGGYGRRRKGRKKTAEGGGHATDENGEHGGGHAADKDDEGGYDANQSSDDQGDDDSKSTSDDGAKDGEYGYSGYADDKNENEDWVSENENENEKDSGRRRKRASQELVQEADWVGMHALGRRSDATEDTAPDATLRSTEELLWGAVEEQGAVGLMLSEAGEASTGRGRR